ncbi:MAG TPA: isoaspartyl peptidase/L-asparaginase, partial [Planctomycetota bacterium]|nr:isoaspartyl peptidase/L-asparaginase [Planctomycetota bacterium]
TEASRKAWEEWKKTQPAGGKDHDTVGVIALDSSGDLAVAVSTSGLAWKLPGRVGDSPIPGAGYYADSEVGAACATGIGEEVLRVSGSFLVVEGMRRGLEPEQAIREALKRIRINPPRVPNSHSRQVGFLALRKDGALAAGALEKGFSYAVGKVGGEAKMNDAPVLE